MCVYVCTCVCASADLHVKVWTNVSALIHVGIER